MIPNICTLVEKKPMSETTIFGLYPTNHFALVIGIIEKNDQCSFLNSFCNNHHSLIFTVTFNVSGPDMKSFVVCEKQRKQENAFESYLKQKIYFI